MYTKVNLSGVFKPRMFLLALITGLTIALTMPLTYFSLTMKEYRSEAQSENQQLIQEMRHSIIALPNLWYFSLDKYLQILGQNQIGQICKLNIYDQSMALLHVVAVHTASSSFVIREKTAIKLNNNHYGYLEIIKNADSIWSQSVILLFLFTALGAIIGIILYRFPQKIVLNAEKKINRAIENLEKLSYLDTLTGLPNRFNINSRLQDLIRECDQCSNELALLFLDINRFKLINDNLGHNVGDLLLKAFAERIAGHLDDKVIFARISGDEFVIVMPDSEPKKIIAIYERIVAELEKPFLLAEHELYITISIGVSQYPDDARDIDSLFKSADLAMYHSKDRGKNQLTFSSPAIKAEARRKLTVENDLRKALTTEEIVPFYQPIVIARTGAVIGFEALARWIHPVNGILLPNHFIPIAEETELIIPLGFRILKLACETLHYWHQKGFKVYVSVNLSVNQFIQCDLLTNLDSVIAATGIDPAYLQIEITESITMGNESQVIKTLKSIHEKRLRIAIDDFGTAYSSLGQLQNYSSNVLKIGRSFIEKIPSDQNNITIVNFIINLAHSLALKVVAEGVENAEQVAILQQLNCDELQGHFFGKPLSQADALKILTKETGLIAGSPG
jgi:diguanylate cyclase (GGDEF)-like protein